MKNRKSKTENPLSFKNILAGLIVTVLGGIIVAYIIQDARFSSNQEKSNPTLTPAIEQIRTQSVILTLPPNSTQIVSNSTVIINIEQGKTVSIYDGKVFITITMVDLVTQSVSATIGSPGCANQAIKLAPIGYAFIYGCEERFDTRIASITRRDEFFSSILGVELYVTELEK